MNKNELIENKDVQDFVVKFFEVENGIRARIRRNGGNSFGYVSDDKNKYGYPLSTITKDNVEKELRYNPYFLGYIFDEGIQQCESRASVSNLAIGYTPFMDCDSPYIDPSAKPVVRKNCLEKGNEYIIEMFEDLRLITKDELNEWGLWGHTREQFSGNGIYFILPDLYTSLGDVQTGINHIYHSINNEMRKIYPDELPMVDTRSFTWNRFIKCPWTTHVKYTRVSIPLNKNKQITKDVLKMSSLRNMTPRKIKNIIEDADWW